MGHDAAASTTDDPIMVRCQTCGRPFDERAYQIVVSELGSFESIECAEKALAITRSAPATRSPRPSCRRLRISSRSAPAQNMADFTESEEAQPA